jgi:hypothetical protein
LEIICPPLKKTFNQIIRSKLFEPQRNLQKFLIKSFGLNHIEINNKVLNKLLNYIKKNILLILMYLIKKIIIKELIIEELDH